MAKLKGMFELAMGTQSNELLYGKAGTVLFAETSAFLTCFIGYLYSLLFVLRHVKPDDAELSDLAMKIALQIVKEGREKK